MNTQSRVLGLLLIPLIAGTGYTAEPEAPRLRLLVPAYFYPAGDGWKEWERLFDSPARPALAVIVNPASGPGAQADPNYLKVLDRAKKADLLLLGYVTTSYGKRTAEDVKADVDRWLHLYPGIQGIFFDEQASAADKLEYQTALYDYVRREKKRSLVVTNPGTVCAEEYLSKPALDVGCLFEGPQAKDGFGLPGWVGQHARRVAVLSYQVEKAERMQQYVKQAADKGLGYIYVTDAAGANPWDRLPRYWNEEIAAVQEVNRRKPK